jgi:hypothetical protein
MKPMRKTISSMNLKNKKKTRKRKTIMKINLHKLSRNVALTSFIYCLESDSSPRV